MLLQRGLAECGKPVFDRGDDRQQHQHAKPDLTEATYGADVGQPVIGDMGRQRIDLDDVGRKTKALGPTRLAGPAIKQHVA
ncbi:hypothetical protein ACVJH7_004153 [Bradyrhizobium elkanii]